MSVPFAITPRQAARAPEHGSMLGISSIGKAIRRLRSCSAQGHRNGRGNVIQVILADVTLQQLASAERDFIHQLSPVFNILGIPSDVALPRAVQRLIGSSICEDVRIIAAQLLRRNHRIFPLP